MKKILDIEMDSWDLNASDDILKNVFEKMEEEPKNEMVRMPYKKTIRIPRVAVAAIALALVGTTTVAATSTIAKIKGEKEGEYASKVSVSVASEYELPEEISEVYGVFTVVPEGMEYYHDWKLTSEEEDVYITPVIIILDKEIDEDLVLPFSKETTNLIINNHGALRVLCNNDSTIYFVLYPEVNRVVEFYVGSAVDDKTALEAIGGYELTETGVIESSNCMTWSEFVAQENGVSDDSDYTFGIDDYVVYDSLEGANLINVGDSVSFDESCISVKVSDVSLYDDLSALNNDEEIPSNWKKIIGEDGKFVKNKIQYIKSGDGINTLDEVLDTKECNQKLVYATIEYTNNGEETINDLFYYIGLNYVIPRNGEYSVLCMYDRSEDMPQGADRWQNSNGNDIDWSEMLYKDCDRSGLLNYIDHIAPGETVKVNVAYMVNEDVLPSVLLNIEAPINSGTSRGVLVDIRQ